MERNTNKDGLQRCPHCQKEFKQLSKHMPSCKKRQDNEAGIHSITAGHPTVPKTSAREERQDPGSTNRMGKPREICDGCRETFICLQKHKPYCKGVTQKTIDRQSPPCKSKLQSPMTSAKKNDIIENSSTADIIIPEDSSRSIHLNSASTLETHESEEKGNEICSNCGKSFKCLAKHIRYCKVQNKKKDANDNNECQITTNCIDDLDIKTNENKCLPHINSRIKLSNAENEREIKSVVNDGDNGSRRLKLSGQKEHISERQHDVVDLLQTASLANMTYSEDPKAELDKLQNENKIVKVEKNAAKEVVEEIQDCFLQRLNVLSTFKWFIFLAGSYSDETKIKSANEFDFIICIDIKCRAECLEEPDKLGYCLVVPSLERNVHEDISSLMKGEYLDPRLVKDMAFKLFKKVIDDTEFHKGRRIKRLYRDSGRPAFTIAYSSGGGKEYEIDLVPAIHFAGWPEISAIRDWQPKWWQKDKLEELKKDYFAVAREHPNAKTVPEGELLWRLSFINTEKMLWLSVDISKRTCRKETLKVLNGILEKYKNPSDMPNLSSFHLRTFMLHQYDERPSDNDWLEKNRRTCLQVCIDKLQESLIRKDMDNYYVSGHNVLEIMEEKEIEFFLKALDEAKTRY